MYRIVNSGKAKEVTLDQISRNLRPQSEIYSIQEVENYLGVISHKTLVFFATEFADYALQNYAKKKSPKVKACIALVRKWIKDDTSVSNEELRAAADAATYDAAANAVAYAAYAAAADAAYYAAYYAATAAYAAAAAAGKDRDKEYIRQGEFIIDFLKSGKNLFLV